MNGLEYWITSTNCCTERVWNSLITFSETALSTLKTVVEEQKVAANEWANLASDLCKNGFRLTLMKRS